MKEQNNNEITQCPIDHHQLSMRWMPFPEDNQTTPSVFQDEKGVWHVKSYKAVKQILRDRTTRQAGFNAEVLRKMRTNVILSKLPVIFQDGIVHTKQRSEIARFFTPKTIRNNYQPLMHRYANEMLATLHDNKQADLSLLAIKMVAGIAAEVVGLTNSLWTGMAHRLDQFIRQNSLEQAHQSQKAIKQFMAEMGNQKRMLKFLLIDVKPAISARKKQPQQDIISHLIANNYTDIEIMVECLTYGTAGIVTTREFIIVATKHMLENDLLRQKYLAAEEAERYQLLEEILRLDPIASHLYRRTTEDIQIDDSTTIPAGDLIDLHIYAANVDSTLFGENATSSCPMRKLPLGVLPSALSFGDGPHRCPGAYIAIQQSDVFLHKLLSIPTLRLMSQPTLHYRDTIAGYEVHDFIVSISD